MLFLCLSLVGDVSEATPSFASFSFKTHSTTISCQTFLQVYNFVNSPMVFMVIVIGSEVNLVHGTCIKSSRICPEIKLKGDCNSCSSTSNLKSKLWKDASPPHNET